MLIVKTDKFGNPYDFVACDRDGRRAKRKMRDDIGREFDLCGDCAFKLQSLKGYQFVDGFGSERPKDKK